MPEAPFEMDLDGRDPAAGQLRHFSEGPVEAMDQDDSRALPRREAGQCRTEAGLDPRVGVLGPVEDHRLPAASTLALGHAEQEGDLVVHPLQSAPVLPGPSQGLGGRFPATVEPVGGDKGATETRFDVGHEGLELLCVGHRGPVMFALRRV